MERDNLQLIKAGSTSVINALGETIFSFSLSLKLLKVTGSALGYGTSLFIGPIVGLALAPILGKVIDKYSHKKLALLAESLLIASLLLYLVAYSLGTNILYTAIVLVCAMNIFGRLFSITYLSSTPQIVGKKSIQRLNSIQTTGVSMASIVAAPLAGFLFGIVPFAWIILVEIAAESFTLLITWLTHFDSVTPKKVVVKNTEKINLIEVLKKQPQLVVLTVIAMVLNLADISLQIGIPFVLIHTLKYSAAVSGNVQGVLSFGVFVGGIIITIVQIKDVFKFEKVTYWLSVVNLLALGFSIKAFPQATLVIFVVIEFISGFVGAISDPPVFTYVQEVIPAKALGRVNTLMYTMVQILNPIGVLIYSSAFAIVDYQILYLVNGLITAVLVALLFTQFKRASKN
ncbi:MFS transporter [Companilactobacillus sp. HBUAS56257]|uniref:MFS transporter n=1 Tax=Companilactobacillus sp. HBUAS56257 TaxID=3109360 RepID=UPI002FEFF35C